MSSSLALRLLPAALELGVALALVPAARRTGGLRSPWALLAGVALVIAVARQLTGLTDSGGVGLVGAGEAPGAIGPEDVAYLAAGWLMVAALVQVWRLQRHRLARADLLDAGLVTACLSLAVLVHLMNPLLETATTWPQRVMAVAVPLQSLVVLALAVVVVGHRHYDRHQAALTLSVALLAANGVLAGSGSRPAWPMLLLAPAAYGIWLALAYSPRARSLTQGEAHDDDGPPVVRRIGVLAVSAFGLNLAVILTDSSPRLLAVTLLVLALVLGRCLRLVASVRRAYDHQLTEAEDERLLARVALALVEAETPAAVHRTSSEGALSLLAATSPVAVALAVGSPDDLQVVVMSGNVGLAGAVNLDQVLADNAADLTEPRLTRCGRGLLVPVVGRSGPLGVLAVLAPGARLDHRTAVLSGVARQTAVALEAVAGASRVSTAGTMTAPAHVMLAMRGPLPAPHSVTDLHRGLRAGEIRAVFQPVVRLADRSTVGYEALARWEHPQRGSIPPVRFLGTAIDSGLIVPLGRQLLTQVVTTAARVPLGVRELTVAVNLCAAELRAPGLLDVLRTLLVANSVSPERLVVEVTESTVLEDVETVSGVLGDLRELGVKVHLDDFGTGFSSLSWLRQLPLDGIKIDRSFVADLQPGEGGGTAPVVEGITRMAQVLDLTVVAEGVESELQAASLDLLGCHLGQGWALGRPGPLDHDRVSGVLVTGGGSPAMPPQRTPV